MNVVIVGGSGFVGLNLAHAFEARGDRVLLVDRSPPPLDLFPFRQADVREPLTLDRGVDCLVLGAAITADAARDASAPESVVETNLAALPALLRSARDVGVRRVINLSSVGAYGEAAFCGHALREDDAVDPRSLYSITKFASERVCDRLAELWQLDVISVRLSAVFGPWERHTGVRDTPSPFFQVMRLAALGEDAVLPRPGLRDWLYSPDMATAVLALAEAPHLSHRLYNVGPGSAFSVLDWARHIPGLSCRVGTPVNVDLGGTRDRASLCIDRLQSDTGFRARFGVAQSASHLRAWAREHPAWFKEEG